MTERLYRDKDWLFTQRFKKRLSLRKIAALCDVSYECIRKRLLKYGFLEDSDGLLKKKNEEFDRLVKENADFILTVLCKGEDKEFWERILSSVMDREKKQNLAEPKKVGRVTHRPLHPGDTVSHGGGEPVSSKYYDPKYEGKTFAQEMDELQEIADTVTS